MRECLAGRESIAQSEQTCHTAACPSSSFCAFTLNNNIIPVRDRSCINKLMSSKPTEEPSLEGGWYRDGLEKMDRLGGAVAGFDDSEDGKELRDDSGEFMRLSRHAESNRLPVVMETTSTGHTKTY